MANITFSLPFHLCLNDSARSNQWFLWDQRGFCIWPIIGIARESQWNSSRCIELHLDTVVKKPKILHVPLCIPSNLNIAIAVSLRRICDDSFRTTCKLHEPRLFVLFSGFYGAIMRRSRLNEKSQSVFGINQVYGYFLVMRQLSIQRIVCVTAHTQIIQRQQQKQPQNNFGLLHEMHESQWKGAHFPNSFDSTFYYNPSNWCGKSALFAVLIKKSTSSVCRKHRVNLNNFIDLGNCFELKWWILAIFFSFDVKLLDVDKMSLLVQFHVMSRSKVELPPFHRS